MNSNLLRKVKKVFYAMSNLNKITKKILNIGLKIFFLIFSIGTLLLSLDIFSNGKIELEEVGISLIKSSIIILAEVVIGSLILDYVFNKEDED